MSFRRRRTRRSFKRGFRGRRVTPLRRLRRRRRQTVNVSKRITKLEKLIEKKTFDTQFDASVNTTGTITYLQAIGVGTSDIQRVGKKVQVTSLEFTMTIRQTDLAATEGNGLRIILFRDKQNRAAVPAVSDLLTTASFHAFRNKANYARFDIIRDKRYTITRFVISGRQYIHDKWFFKLGTKRGEWKWLDSVEAELGADKGGEGALYICYIREDASNVVNLDLHMRARYMDA